MLFDPDRHETLGVVPWDETQARAAIARIVGETNAAFTSEGLWPIHPLDVSDERPPDCLKMLYNGAAGVIWALRRLDETGAAPLVHDFMPTVGDLARRHAEDLAAYPKVREYLGAARDAFLFGETGLRLLEWKLAPSADVVDRLTGDIAAKIGDNRGIVWGGAGSMLAALALHRGDGNPTWRELFIRHARALWEQWDRDEHAGCHLWTIDLYGIVEQRIGALHGAFANAAALIRGRTLLPGEMQGALGTRIAELLRATALFEGHRANWPGAQRLQRLPFVQFCNGAPGAIAAFAGHSGISGVDELLLMAGECIWEAGPLAKLPCLCHGTPGNGYALLKLYACTGDAMWLDRARRFAMHAISQSDAARARHGQRKFSLWTGDLGLALFLASCVSGDAAFPTLDYF